MIESHSPVTGKSLGLVPEMDAEEVAVAIARARDAARSWSQLSIEERCQQLRRARDAMLENADDLVDLICAETGKTRVEAWTSELLVTAELIEYYLKHAGRILAARRVGSGTLKTKRAWKRYSPLGVIGVISPWNYPFSLTMTPVVTALFAGNAVVLKPSEVTPLVGCAASRTFEATDHPDIVQVVTGGASTGQALVSGDVDKISFTGSVSTGRLVAMAAAQNLTPVLLELGGKDPMIICEDADLDRAANAAVWGAFTNAGQTCISVERVYAVESIYDQFVARVTERAREVIPGKHVGSMTFAPQLDVVRHHLDDALSKGARVLLGGHQAEGLSGMFFEPTVVVDVDHTMAIMTEETFGPILCIMKVPDDTAALDAANDSRYGLSASVFTRSAERRDRIVRDIAAGSICVNDCLANYAIPSLPFGGVKMSGTGRSHGPEGLYEFSATKSVSEDITGLRADPLWFPPRRAFEAASKRFLQSRYHSSLRQRLRGLILGSTRHRQHGESK
jgi:acyl-CoA reductase-like NAD-dependent aldehyde dehydrogenase